MKTNYDPNLRKERDRKTKKQKQKRKNVEHCRNELRFKSY